MAARMLNGELAVEHSEAELTQRPQPANETARAAEDSHAAARLTSFLEHAKRTVTAAARRDTRLHSQRTR